VNDDLAPLFAEPAEQPSQDWRFRQGVIVTFNQITLQNTVLVGGTVMTDLPLLGVGEATLLVPGAVVGIASVGDATKTMFIAGRVVTPNTADSASAVSLLNSQIFTDFVVTGENCSSTSYGDLATVGPRVVVPVGPSGRILIIATAQIQWISATAVQTIGDGRFDVEFAGANTRSPNEVVDPLVGLTQLNVTTNAGTNSSLAIQSTTTQGVFGGLTPGNTTITMKYRKGATSTSNIDFFRRTLTVFKL
jgi:hypothetical protein